MTHSIKILALVFLTLSSCQNKNQESKSEADKVQSGMHSELEPGNKTFDWSLTQLLKQRLISDLKSKPYEIDKSIIRFLDEYESIENEFNDILFGLSSYDSLNTLAYAPYDVVYNNAIEFKEIVEKNGLSIVHSEGMIYLGKNADYIKSNVLELLDPISLEFIVLYCQEIEELCCDDAAILLSDKKLVKRALLWGNLLEKVEKLEYIGEAKRKFDTYLLLVFLGQDNTPSFDWPTFEFNKNIFEAMTEIIENYPNSKATNEFKLFTELLISENFKKTAKIQTYLFERFN